MQQLELGLTGELPADAWIAYERFNASIATEFFAGTHAHRPVYIDLEVDTLAHISQRAGMGNDGRSALISAVRPTLSIQPAQAVFARHRRRQSGWSAVLSPDPPPYLAVLALLSLVAEEMRNDEHFRGNAYYGRLIEMLEGDPQDEALHKRVRAGHRTDVQRMWRELNVWLRQDPTRGIATAHAFDHRAYIGPALSQALVRAGDRSAFSGLFSAARLFPGQVLSKPDMVDLLRDWVPKARVSRSLKRLCSHEATLEQVAEVAIAELLIWDGQGRGATMHTQGLRLAGRLRARPRKALELSLLARLPEGDALFECAGSLEDVTLTPQDSVEMSLRPVHASHALANTAVVMSEVGEHQVARTPRRIVVLHRGEGGLLAEVERVLLGELHVVLVPDAMTQLITEALEEVARPGFVVSAAAKGLPRGWTMFAGVEVVALSDRFKKHFDLAALTPIGWSSLALQGGFRLPSRSCWLEGAPPRLALSVLEGGEVEVTLELLLDAAASDVEGAEGVSDEDGSAPDDALETDAIGDEVPTATVLRTRVGTLDAIDLDEKLVLRPGRYVISARRPDGGELVAHERLTVFAPTPHTIFAGTPSGTPIEHPLWPLGGTPLMRGALIAPSGPAADDDAETPDLPTTLTLMQEAPAPDEEPPTPEFSSDAPACFHTGGHRLLLPDNKPGGVTGTCSMCGLEKWFPQRTVHSYDQATRQIRIPRLLPVADPSEQHVLLALSAVGRGTREGLGRIIEQVDDAPWGVIERARTLSALAHLDLAFDPRGDLVSWQVAPPALASTPAGDAVLCGWRSEALLHRLGVLSERLGGGLTIEALDGAPERVAVHDLDDDDMELLCLEASDVLGLELAFARRPGEALALALPEVRTLLNKLPLDAGHQSLEWRRPGTWAWEAADRLGVPGTYRTRSLPRRYYVHDGFATYRCESSLARWLANPRAFPHLAYDPESLTLTVPLGGRLPVLWERAAVLCSGCPPLRAGGRLAYLDVDPRVARRLAVTLATSTERITAV